MLILTTPKQFYINNLIEYMYVKYSSYMENIYIYIYIKKTKFYKIQYLSLLWDNIRYFGFHQNISVVNLVPWRGDHNTQPQTSQHSRKGGTHISLLRPLDEDGTTEEGKGGGQAQRRNCQELRDLLGRGHVRCGCGDHGE